MDQSLQSSPRKRSAAYVPALFFLFLCIAFFLFAFWWYWTNYFVRGSGTWIQNGILVPNVYVEFFIMLSQIVAGIFLAVVCSRRKKTLNFVGVGLFAAANTLMLAYPTYVFINTLFGQRWFARHNFKSTAITLLFFAALFCLLAAAVSATVLAAIGSFSVKRAATARKLWFLPGALCALSVMLIVLACLPYLIPGAEDGNVDSLSFVILALLLAIPAMECGVYFFVCRCLSVAGAAGNDVLSFPVGE